MQVKNLAFLDYPDYEIRLENENKQPEVWSLKKKIPFKMSINNGKVLLSSKEKRRKERVHILVCNAWHGEKPSDDHSVDHINRNWSDNRPINLRWATYKEQTENRTPEEKSRKNANRVIATNIKTGEQRIYNSVKEAGEKYNKSHKTISRWIRNKTVISGWEFIWCDKNQNLENNEKSVFFRYTEDDKMIMLDKTTNRNNSLVEITNHGRFRIFRKNHPNPPFTNGTKTRQGYLRVRLAGNNRFVHQIVYRAFNNGIQIQEGYVIDHKDDSKNNNKLENLQMITLSQNSKKWSDNKRNLVIVGNKNGEIRNWINQEEFAKEFNINRSSVCQAIKREGYCKGWKLTKI